MPSDISRFQASLSTEELQSLLKALGFPKGLFKKNLPKALWEKGQVSVKDLVEFCDLRYFHRDLHYTVNLKPAAYNANALKKSLHLCGTRMLTFTDLENIRLAFETYEDYDQRGLSTSVWTVLKALKLCGRVAAPLKITNKLRHLQPSHKIEGRIQFYEFLDLLALCQMNTNQESEEDRAAPTEKNERNLYRIDEFQYLVIPREKKLWSLLNEQYRQEELRYEKPELLSELFKEQPVDPDDFKLQVRLARENFETTKKRLQESERQVKLSMSGQTSARPRDQSTAGHASSHKSLGKPPTRPPSWAHMSDRTTRHSVVTGSPSYHSAPVFSVTSKEKMKRRPQSCPPVVNKQSREELNAKLNDVRFEISTQKERHKIRVSHQLSSYLPDSHEEVIARLRKPPTAPSQRRRKRRRPKKPSPNFVQRLSQPSPTLPQRHSTHCDAITRGLGDDDHARALQKHGSMVAKTTSKLNQDVTKKRKSPKLAPKQEPPDAKASSWCRRRRVRKRVTLLEKLLQDAAVDPGIPYDDSVPEDAESDLGTEVEEEEEEHPEQMENEENKPVKLPSAKKRDRMKPPRPLPTIRERSPPPPIRYSINRSSHRLEQALNLLKGDFTKIFLDPESFKESAAISGSEEEEDDSLRAESYERFSPSSSSSNGSLETTDFERFLQDESNLSIATMEDTSLTSLPEESGSELLRMRKSFRRIYSRLSDVSSAGV